MSPRMYLPTDSTLRLLATRIHFDFDTESLIQSFLAHFNQVRCRNAERWATTAAKSNVPLKRPAVDLFALTCYIYRYADLMTPQQWVELLRIRRGMLEEARRCENEVAESILMGIVMFTIDPEVLFNLDEAYEPHTVVIEKHSTGGVLFKATEESLFYGEHPALHQALDEREHRALNYHSEVEFERTKICVRWDGGRRRSVVGVMESGGGSVRKIVVGGEKREVVLRDGDGMMIILRFEG